MEDEIINDRAELLSSLLALLDWHNKQNNPPQFQENIDRLTKQYGQFTDSSLSVFDDQEFLSGTIYLFKFLEWVLGNPTFEVSANGAFEFSHISSSFIILKKHCIE